MLRRLLVVFIAISGMFHMHATAQKIINYQNGKLQISAVNQYVTKLSFAPNGYVKNENISDAVLLLPNKQLQPAFQQKGDTIIIGNMRLVGTHATNNYRGFHFLLAGNEQIFGGGERALPLNRRGYRFNLYNNPWYGYEYGADNLNYSVPFFTSSANYAILFDNPSKGWVDIGKTNNQLFTYGAFSGELCFYVISGANNAEILQRYHQLTGTQPLPPRWALGNFMSRFGYVSEQQTRDISQKMTDAHIPFDAIIHDLFWFGDSIKNTLGNLEWVNKKAWPNPAKMIADFNAQNRKTILITEPFVLEPTLNYALGKPFLAVDSANNTYTLTKFYFGKGGIIDVFRKDAQAWFWQFYHKQMKQGVEGWWGDLGEPENHPTDVYHNLKDKGFNRLFSADEVHNAFGHNWTKMLYEQFAKNYPNKRLFSLNRSGFAGTQRYSIFPWSGDVSRNWSGYAAQLPVMLGMSMSGVPYIHADAGGFAGGEGSNELYIRWLQFAAYTPIFRPHGTALYEKDPNAFSFPSEPALFNEPTRKIAKEIVQQRYAMLPYNYTLAYEQAVNGSPLARPLYYAFPNDADACKVEDSYMWGNNLLIAPILQPNQQSRSIYLPKGSNWYINNTNKQYIGGQTINLPTPLSFMPVMVKAGAFIPQYPVDDAVNTTADLVKKGDLVIHYYADDAASSYTLYEDDGESKLAISEKAFELITIKSIPKKGGFLFDIRSNGGNYKGKHGSRTIQLIVHQSKIAPTLLMVNGEITETLTSGKNDFQVSLNFNGKPLTVAIK